MKLCMEDESPEVKDSYPRQFLERLLHFFTYWLLLTTRRASLDSDSRNFGGPG